MNNLRLVLLFYIYFELLTLGHSHELELVNEEDLKDGRKHYEELLVKSRLPRYGICWQNVVAELEEGCKALNEKTQQKLAFQFANCFLSSSGKDKIVCSVGRSLEECIGLTDHTAFSSYQTFYVHTQSICFFLRNQLWQESAQITISQLSSTSHKVARNLEEVVLLQGRTIDSQKLLLEQGVALGESLDDTRRKASDTFKEFERTTQEQSLAIHRVFDRVVSIQSSVFGMFTGLDSIIFYTVACSVSYLVTSPTRTRASRIFILPLWAFNVFLEYRLKHMEELKTLDQSHFSEERHHWLVLVWRCITCILASGIFAYHYYFYQDYNYLAMRRLDDVMKEIGDLRFLMQGIGGKPIENRDIPSIPWNHNFGGYESDSETETSHDSTFVGNSSDDDTFSTTSNDSFMTSFSHGSNDTFLTSFSQRTSSNSSVHSAVAHTQPFNNSSLLEKNINNRSGQSHYNLRSRDSSVLMTSLQTINPIVMQETPKSFERVVKNLAKQSKVIRRSIVNAKRLGKNQFSSEED